MLVTINNEPLDPSQVKKYLDEVQEGNNIITDRLDMLDKLQDTKGFGIDDFISDYNGNLGVDEILRQQVADQTSATIWGFLDGVENFIIDFSYSFTLIGAGVALIAYVIGWEKGKKWVGFFMLGNVLVKFLLAGGYNF